MTDRGLRAESPRSGARGSDNEHPSEARPRPRVQRGSPSAQAAGPSASWQAPAAWFDDHDGGVGPADLGADLVNMGFIGAALRRSRRWWVGLAVVGFLLGAAVWATHPPVPTASTTLLLEVGPEPQPNTAIQNDQVMAQSRGVAAIALRRLGLRQSVERFQGTYTASVITDQVLLITASAPNSDEAVRRANGIATAFLAFRAVQLQEQQRLQFAALDKVLTQSERHLAAIDARISSAAGKPAELASLRETRARAESVLVTFKSQVSNAKAAAQETTAAMVGKSGVLAQASPVNPSRLKPLILLSGAGLIIGLFMGAALVILRALISDRLRRRDDVALALGAPVRLSISVEPISRWRPGRRGMAAAQSRDVQRIVAFLRGTLPTGSRPGALAVVPVDEPRVAALSLVSLAATLAQTNARVVVADLCNGTPAAKLVGLKDPGVHAVTVDGAQIEVAIPSPDEIAPLGPFSRTTAQAQPALAEQVAAACASADVLLTLTALDPSLASDHLRSWAPRAVVVVTAGRSSWTKIHAVGELIRLAGVRLVSAVLVRADKWDESLGVTATRAVGRDAAPADHGDARAMPFDDARKSGLPGTTTSATADAEQPRRQQRQQRQQPKGQSRSQDESPDGGKQGSGRPHDSDDGTSGGKTA